MTGLRSSPFTLFPERDVRDKGSEAIVQGIEKMLLDATYSFELLKRDVERLANQPALNTDALGDVLTADDLATVATTGSYNDLTDTPSLATVATSGLHSDLTLDDGTNPHGTTASDVGAVDQPIQGTLTSASSSGSISASVSPSGFDLSVDYIAKHTGVVSGPTLVFYETNILADWDDSAETLSGVYIVRYYQVGGNRTESAGDFSYDLGSASPQTIYSDANGVSVSASLGAISGDLSFGAGGTYTPQIGDRAVLKATRFQY